MLFDENWELFDGVCEFVEFCEEEDDNCEEKDV